MVYLTCYVYLTFCCASLSSCCRIGPTSNIRRAEVVTAEGMKWNAVAPSLVSRMTSDHHRNHRDIHGITMVSPWYHHGIYPWSTHVLGDLLMWSHARSEATAKSTSSKMGHSLAETGSHSNVKQCQAVSSNVKWFKQGLLNVPFWVYWTSPYSSQFNGDI